MAEEKTDAQKEYEERSMKLPRRTLGCKNNPTIEWLGPDEPLPIGDGVHEIVNKVDVLISLFHPESKIITVQRLFEEKIELWMSRRSELWPLRFCRCSPYEPEDVPVTLLLEEKFVVCAAVHDALTPSFRWIDFWGERPDGELFGQDPEHAAVKAWNMGARYKQVVHATRHLHDADVPMLLCYAEELGKECSKRGFCYAIPGKGG